MEAVTSLFSERFLLELVLKGALLMMIAFAITYVLRRKSAALRHAIWSLAFIGLLLLPVGAALLPAWQIAVPDLGAVDVLLPKKSESPVSINLPLDRGTVGTDAPLSSDVTSQAGEPTTSALWTSPVASTLPDSHRSWARVALLLWMVGAVVLFIRMAMVLRQLSHIRRSARPVANPAWTELAESLPKVLDVRRPVVLLQHEDVVVPMTYGVRRPVILLPVHADEWSVDQKHVTLMHELLHVRRFDHLVHVLALSARALHWFNPLTWAATKRLVVERERACDDGVLAMGIASTCYADHLLGMARFVLTGKEASAAAVAMARPSELRSRIVAILNPGQPRQALTRAPAFGIAACALLLVILMAAVQPGSATLINDVMPVTLMQQSELAFAGAETIIGSSPELARIATEGDIEADEPAESGDITLAEERSADTTDIESQRRAIHAISELPQERSIPLLKEIAESHRNPELREEAIFWLGQVGDGSTVELLESFARSDASRKVQKKAIFALSELENELGVPILMGLAESNLSADVREEVVFWLGQAGGADVADELETFARSDASREVQKKAIFALSDIDGDAGVPHLIDLAKTHPNVDMQAEAVFWLSEAGGSEVADILADFARTASNREIQKKAIFALSEIDGDAGVPHLIDLARSHPDDNVRSEAIFWLGETGDPRAADVLMEIVNGR